MTGIAWKFDRERDACMARLVHDEMIRDAKSAEQAMAALGVNPADLRIETTTGVDTYADRCRVRVVHVPTGATGEACGQGSETRMMAAALDRLRANLITPADAEMNESTSEGP